MSDKVYIFDTTLRDGEQSPGATMNMAEKITMARQLEKLGVDIIEAGFPAASQGDFDAVTKIAESVGDIQVAGLCRALISDIDRAYDAVKHARNPRIHTFIATSDIHMKHKFNKEPEQILEMARKAVRHAASLTPNVEFSAEDASRSRWDFLAQVVEAAIEEGATTINIPDTVGYAQPEEFGKLITYLLETVPNSDKAVFSVHCHNDLGLGVANTLAAIKAGARQAEVTLSGIGERAGNAALEEVIMALHTRKDYYDVETSIVTEHLFPSCRRLATTIGQPISPYKAIVGANAFAHESGIHQDGMLKNRQTYEIMTPESIGKKGTSIVIGKHSGRNALGSKLTEMGYHLDDTQIAAVFKAIKTLADKKEEIFDEDVEALVLEEAYRIHDLYRVKELSVFSGTAGVSPHAAIVLEDFSKGSEDPVQIQEVGFGGGPINAVFSTINKMVGRDPKLELYSVNAVTGGTDAQGAVMVHITDNGVKSIGRGSDEDIIVASAKAYINAINRIERMKQEKQNA
ncbi:2-isopropylmalate synthase [Maridesulfovibrio hydrothermalis]|uniref:2-isopropylmalate synthase n=1 Tax=Maridesulfovibrio hydrothermalis AM13 = DSM 14728 TaxID=1121451 RepID=L0RDB6_9BACT|nr:2-isopropylmalate synthase [Maridesulfovibrio hydrothermalis]CCO24195.1 2-isopropylmalate synthase [Maridesulfovibrio hydrothermalis AM13 = DSM 14728]